MFSVFSRFLSTFLLFALVVLSAFGMLVFRQLGVDTLHLPLVS